MGTIKDDSCLRKIRDRAGVCVVCDKGITYPNHHCLGDDFHEFVDSANEPIFVLRAQDVTTVTTIQDWLKRNPDLPAEKREEALSLIDKVLVWPKKKQAD